MVADPEKDQLYLENRILIMIKTSNVIRRDPRSGKIPYDTATSARADVGIVSR